MTRLTTMRRLLSTAGLLALVLMVLMVGILKAQAPTSAADAPAQAAALTDLQQARVEAHLLRVENAQLRAALAKLQADYDTLTLGAERAELLETLRRELHAPPEAVFDWQARRFTAPEARR